MIHAILHGLYSNVHWKKKWNRKIYTKNKTSADMYVLVFTDFPRKIPRFLWGEVLIKVNKKKKEFLSPHIPKSCIFYSTNTWPDHCSLQKTWSERASSKRKWRRTQQNQTQLSSRSCIFFFLKVISNWLVVRFV